QLMKAVIPDFPRTEDYDLGLTPPVLDPHRNPLEKLPGKKARKKMAEARAARRAGGDGGSESRPKTSEGPRKTRSSRAGSAHADKPREIREAGRAGDGGRPTRSRRVAPQHRTNEDRDGREENVSTTKRGAKNHARAAGKSEGQRAGSTFGPARKPTATPKRLKRHPGDRGGRR
ncbi:MAG: hypothetical protein J6D54_05755, partial [Olsenella sp.]|nr:hypothetical protein [Olsenella sp.]